MGFHTYTHTIWPGFGAINLAEDRLKLCNIYESIQPLAFYKDHLYSTSLRTTWATSVSPAGNWYFAGF